MAEVAGKVKKLLWRAVILCLPCKVQLRRKHVNVNEVCLMCNEDAETIIHSPTGKLWRMASFHNVNEME